MHLDRKKVMGLPRGLDEDDLLVIMWYNA